MTDGLRAALDGSGPALLPVPATDVPLRESLLASTKPDQPLESDDVALVVPTSGSSGRPRGVLLEARAVHASARASLERLGGPGRWLLALPTTSIGGLQVLVRSLLAETEPVVVDLTDGFRAAPFVEATTQLGPGRRYTSLVPIQLARLIDAGGPATGALASYDAVLVGGAATPEALARRARESGIRLVLTYGMTETSGGCVYDGVPLDDVRVEVDDAGHVAIAGPVLARGYRLDRAATEGAFAGNRFHTQDLGRLRPDGRLEVLGRADDVIVTGGVNVSPTQIEEALQAHGEVMTAAVIGAPDDEWGQRVVAFVVARGEPPAVDALRAHVRATVGKASAPREVVVVPALPMLPNGKVDRVALRSLARRTER